MSLAIRLLAIAACAAQFARPGSSQVAAAPQDASRTLAEARDKILAKAAHLPKYVCVETIDRSYLSRPDPPDSPPSCEQIAIDRKKGRNRPQLDYTDRVRVTVAKTQDREIFSWTGGEPVSYSVEDILHPGPIGTGAFAAHLLDIFSNPSVRFRLLQESPETVEYGFQVPVEASHYSVAAGAQWLAAAYSGSLRLERASQAISRFTVETNELPPQTSACEIGSGFEFGNRAEGAGWLTPSRSTTHNVLRDTSETDSVTTISDCRMPSATLPEQASSQGAPLAPNIVISMVFDTPIDSDIAAAGDVISATITDAYSAESKAVEFPALKGATVRGRLARIEHRMARPGQPAVFVFSVAFETLDVKGIVSPFYARLIGLPRGARLIVADKSTHPPPVGHGRNDWFATFDFASKDPRYVVDPALETEWLTTAPDAGK